jgi:hypothetical protein
MVLKLRFCKKSYLRFYENSDVRYAGVSKYISVSVSLISWISTWPMAPNWVEFVRITPSSQWLLRTKLPEMPGPPVSGAEPGFPGGPVSPEARFSRMIPG